MSQNPSATSAAKLRSLIRRGLGPLPEIVRYGVRPTERAYGRPVAWDGDGNAIVRDALHSGKPCLVTRIGLSELMCVSHYSRIRRRLPSLGYTSYIRQLMHVNAGYFPADDASLDRFSRRFLDDMSQADVMGVWFNRNEHKIVKAHCPQARLVELGALNSMCYEGPWSAELAGKSVLVVHPFAKSIESQYRSNRDRLFARSDVLPEFELKTLMPVQSIAGAESGFSNWFEALDNTCERIAAESFHIAIIGAGAYGLPLGAFVKSMGRQAVHLGGATQVLFGIIGRRWETEYADTIGAMVNEHWIRPLPEETPRGACEVEGGCYW